MTITSIGPVLGKVRAREDWVKREYCGEKKEKGEVYKWENEEGEVRGTIRSFFKHISHYANTWVIL